MILKLEIGPNTTADLVALGWLPAVDHVDKDALVPALVGLIDRAIELRVTPTTGSEGVCYVPLRVTAGPIAVGFDESAGLSPKLGRPSERVVAPGLGPGRVELAEVLGIADGAADSVENKPPKAEPRDRIDTADIAIEHAELDRVELSETQPFDVDPEDLWGPRLSLYRRWRIWDIRWGPRPDQDGCQAPDWLL